MKPIKHNILLLCFILFVMFQINANSQSMKNKFWKPYHWFVGINAGPTQTGITTHGRASVISDIKSTRKNSFYISFDLGYLVTKNIDISTGIGLSPYFTDLSLDSYLNSFDAIDSENESYERRISANNIKETQKIIFLDIPLLLTLQYPLSKTSGFYFQSGVNLSIPGIKVYSNSGNYSYSGYYPAYNVLLTDIPYEGFKNNVTSDLNGELRIKTINPEMVASGGYFFNPEKRYQVSLGFFFRKIFTDITDYSPVSSFQLSTQENQVKSFMEGSEKVTTSSMGIKINLRYFIK